MKKIPIVDSNKGQPRDCLRGHQKPTMDKQAQREVGASMMPQTKDSSPTPESPGREEQMKVIHQLCGQEAERDEFGFIDDYHEKGHCRPNSALHIKVFERSEIPGVSEELQKGMALSHTEKAEVSEQPFTKEVKP